MCFSPQMDVAAGVVIGVVAVDTLRHVRRPQELPLALLPLVFAVHQLVEALVWWSLQGEVSATTGHRAEWLYLAIAFGVLPVLVPFAVGGLEPASRHRLTAGFVALGGVVAVLLMAAVVRGPIGAVIQGHHVLYRVDLWHGDTLAVLYVLVTCGSMLLSGHSHVRAYGMANLVAVAVLVWIDQTAFVSLWCLWAGITSVLVDLHLRFASRDTSADLRSRAEAAGAAD
jgi:hypothetical protein